MLNLYQLKPNKLTEISESDKCSEPIMFLVEDSKPHIENESELAVLNYDDEWLYVYNQQQFIEIISKIFNLDFLTYDPPPNSESLEKIYEQGGKFSYRTFLINDRTLMSIEQKAVPKFTSFETPSGTVNISSWPVKRKTYVLNAGREEEIDLLELFSKYSRFVDSKEALKRINGVFTTEWEKIHGNKKPKDVYPDRVDREFPKEYGIIEYSENEDSEKLMQKEWYKLHGNKKQEYIR